MARRLVLAVAGSGKTAHLIDQLDLARRYLVIAYTTSNLEALNNRIMRKFGYFPTNIMLVSYFVFLHSICYEPFLKLKHGGTHGINFEPCKNKFAKGLDRFIDRHGRLYGNRLAKILFEENVVPDVIARLSKYFDHILIDEFQDISGHDFNLFEALAGVQSDLTCVGDFFQHTYATSQDGNVNKSLHSTYAQYVQRCQKIGLDVDDTTLERSHRCSPTVCDFISNQVGIKIQSHRQDATDVKIVDQANEAADLFEDDHVIKLFYQNSRKYPCAAKNWGDCKGDDHYGSVCVALNPTTITAYRKNALSGLNTLTRNKFYVACTRARTNLYFVSEDLFKDRRRP